MYYEVLYDKERSIWHPVRVFIIEQEEHTDGMFLLVASTYFQSGDVSGTIDPHQITYQEPGFDIDAFNHQYIEAIHSDKGASGIMTLEKMGYKWLTYDSDRIRPFQPADNKEASFALLFDYEFLL